MSRRYLTLSEAERALGAGRAVEQWLGFRDSQPVRVVSWVACRKARDGAFHVTLFRSFDAGTDDFFDVYSFESADGDEAPTAVYANPKDALEHAIRDFGAHAERFVNQGLVQDEYRDHRGPLSKLSNPSNG